jgi:hypothetical protein
MSTFTLVLDGKQFTINKTRLLINSTFVDLHGEAFPKGSYEVRTYSPPSIFEDFIQIVEGVKPISITAENFDYFTELGEEFGSETVSSACLSYRQTLSSPIRSSFDATTMVRLSQSEEQLYRQAHILIAHDELFVQASSNINRLFTDIDRIFSLLTGLSDRVSQLEQRIGLCHIGGSPIFVPLEQSELAKFEVSASDFPRMDGEADSFFFSSRDARDGTPVTVIRYNVSALGSALFHYEVAILSGFHHPTILAFRGFATPDRDPADREVWWSIISDAMPNGSLETWVGRDFGDSRWDNTSRFIVIYGVAVGMMILHLHNICHSQLNLYDVFLDGNFEPKIRGFLHSVSFESGRITHRSFGMGIVCPPELFDGRPQPRPSDVFEFALLLYLFATGYRLFPPLLMHQSEPRGRCALAVRKGYRPPFPTDPYPGYKDLIERCWQGDPKSRPTFADIVRDLGSDLSRFGAIDESRFRSYQKRVLPDGFE